MDYIHSILSAPLSQARSAIAQPLLYAFNNFFVSFLTFFLHFPHAFPALVAFFTSLKEAAPFSIAKATSPLVTL